MNPAQHVDLNDLLAFAAVAEAGSFTAAAERLDSSKARLSLQVRRLETALGQELFYRTTRRLTLSEAGAQLLDKSIPPLRLAIEGLSQASRGAAPSAVTGTLRIACTVEHAVHQLAAYVAEFAALHPKLEIDLRSNDRVVDMVGDGIDIALRKGWLSDSSLRAVKLGRFEQILVASPDYLKRVGRPKKPEDLAQHDWLALSLLSTPLTWKFSDKNGQSMTVRMKHPRLRTDNPGTLRSLAEAGAGITALDQSSVASSIEAGRLQRLLPHWQLPEGGQYAVFPPGRHQPPQVQAFMAFYKAKIATA